MLKSAKNCLIVGISGATCSGKTTIADVLHKVIPNSIALNQDQYYWHDDSENHVLAEGINHINWELVSAFDNDRLVKEIKSHAANSQPLKNNNVDFDSLSKRFEAMTDKAKVYKPNYPFFQTENEDDHGVGDMKALLSVLPRIIIIDGILLFNHPELLDICDLKFFFTLDYKTCLQRRSARSYDPPDVPGYFEKIVYPHYIKNLEDMKKLDSNEDIMYLDGANDILLNFKIIGSNIIRSVNSNT